MAKRKPKSLLLPSDSRNVTSPCNTLSSEDEWVIVKKQRITILIPPLSPNEQVTYPGVYSDQMKVIPTESPKNQLPLRVTLDQPVHIAAGNTRHISPPPGTSSQPQKKEPLSKQFVADKGRQLPGTNVETTPQRTKRYPSLQATKQLRRLLIGSVDPLDGGVFLDEAMRASNLNNKIRRAGGLSNWLGSLGLSQFVGIFHRRRVEKFQLVNMTMKKLKDMGAEAVGPRRKLMHAIDCLCQPYCFESRNMQV